MKTDSGCTRIVFIFKTFVVKIPNFRYSWDHFLKGILGNINESRTWKWNSGKYESGKSHLLCPVIWCSWGGWVLIMKRADTESYERWVRSLPPISNTEDCVESNKMFYSQWITAGLGGDDKADNYGYLNGQIVKIDYAQ